VTVVLDASVLIAHLDAQDALHERAEEVLRALAGDPFAASVLTLAEVLVRPAQVERLEEAEHALRRLAVLPVPVPADAAPRLARLRVGTGLRLPDCCVLLAAQDAAAAGVATFDARLAEQAARLGLGVPGS